MVQNVLVSALQHYSAQKLQTAISSDTSANFYQITRRHIEEDVKDHTLQRDPRIPGTIILVRDDDYDDKDDDDGDDNDVRYFTQ